MKVQVAQLGLTLCNPIDYTVHGILQDRILQWVAFPFSRRSSVHFVSPAGEHPCLSQVHLHYTAHEHITIRIN